MRRNVGTLLMSIGVVCFIIYGLMALNGAVSAYNRIGRILLFAGIVALIAGVIRYMTAVSK